MRKLLTDSNSIKVPLNLSELQVLSQKISKDALFIKVQAKSSHAGCPQCQTMSAKVLADDRWRLIRDLPALQMKVFLHLRQRRFFCAGCCRRFLERFSFLAERARQTKRLRGALLKQARSNSIWQVAQTNQVSYRQTAYLCFAKGAQLTQTADSQRLPRRLGIDEFALRKGHN